MHQMLEQFIAKNQQARLGFFSSPAVKPFAKVTKSAITEPGLYHTPFYNFCPEVGLSSAIHPCQLSGILMG